MANVLQGADPAVRTEALELLAEIGKPAVPALIEALQHEKSTYWACLALFEIGPSAAEAGPALAKTLGNDARPEVRREAALALGAIGPASASAVPALVKALGDKENSVAAGAAFALGRIGPGAKSADAALTKSAEGADSLLQAVSVWALAKLDPLNDARKQKAVTRLAAELKNKEPRVRHAAVQGLIDLNAKPEE